MNKDIIINKFINNKKRSYEELYNIFNSYMNGTVSDKEMTVVLKMICKYGMRYKEIEYLTDIFIKSGDMLDLSDISSCIIDKHSTGGIGDKTTLIIGPIVASLGVKVAKMSGKALGYTGGTIDKLESIGVNTNLTEEEFINQVKKINIAITGQTKELCPMDKKIYALRDITGTTESIALIAVSIMSKKIASGANKILIDIKVGNGALIKNISDAKRLAKIMIKLGKKYKREVVCLLSDMNRPLGLNIGNKTEVLEAIDILTNKEKDNNIYELSVVMSSYMLSMAKGIKLQDAKKEVINSIESGKAYDKFKELITMQKGSLDIKLSKPRYIYSKEEGYINDINAIELGKISMMLGAGRIEKDDNIDFNAGIVLNKNLYNYIKKDELLCTYYGKDIDEELILKQIRIENKVNKKSKEILGLMK